MKPRTKIIVGAVLVAPLLGFAAGALAYACVESPEIAGVLFLSGCFIAGAALILSALT